MWNKFYYLWHLIVPVRTERSLNGQRLRIYSNRIIVFTLLLCSVAQAPPVPPFVSTYMRTVNDDENAQTAQETLVLGDNDDVTHGSLTVTKGTGYLKLEGLGFLLLEGTGKIVLEGDPTADAVTYLSDSGTLSYGPLLTWDPDAALFTVDGDTTLTGFEDWSTTAGITATNPGGQGDSPLTTIVNEVATVANGDDAVTLPAASAGRHVVIINNGANQLEIWPASGDNAGGGVDSAVTLASGSNVHYVAYDGTNWESI